MQIEVENKEYLDRQRKGRMMLLSMLIFFITPIIAVVGMYKLDWRPKGESIGELAVPAKLLTMNYALMSSDGSVVKPDVWKDKWSMVYIADNCEKRCHDKLRNMRQIHTSLYKEIPRMQRVFITTSHEVSPIKQDYPDMLIINQPATEISALSDQFNINDTTSLHADRTYLVDPLGHFMMSYAPDTDPALIRKDVIRLMKYSWAG
jgi:cytochrome oxidase Cu insertion factor (SCO1/SenC/PrrC family)